jgi:hypothetical protein
MQSRKDPHGLLASVLDIDILLSLVANDNTGPGFLDCNIGPFDSFYR